MTCSEPSLVHPIHTPVPQTIAPTFQTSAPPRLFQAGQAVSQSVLGSRLSWEGRRDHSCAMGLGRKPSALHLKTSLRGWHKASTR